MNRARLAEAFGEQVQAVQAPERTQPVVYEVHDLEVFIESVRRKIEPSKTYEKVIYEDIPNSNSAGFHLKRFFLTFKRPNAHYFVLEVKESIRAEFVMIPVENGAPIRGDSASAIVTEMVFSRRNQSQECLYTMKLAVSASNGTFTESSKKILTGLLFLVNIRKLKFKTEGIAELSHSCNKILVEFCNEAVELKNDYVTSIDWYIDNCKLLSPIGKIVKLFSNVKEVQIYWTPKLNPLKLCENPFVGIPTGKERQLAHVRFNGPSWLTLSDHSKIRAITNSLAIERDDNFGFPELVRLAEQLLNEKKDCKMAYQVNIACKTDFHPYFACFEGLGYKKQKTRNIFSKTTKCKDTEVSIEFFGYLIIIKIVVDTTPEELRGPWPAPSEKMEVDE